MAQTAAEMVGIRKLLVPKLVTLAREVRAAGGDARADVILMFETESKRNALHDRLDLPRGILTVEEFASAVNQAMLQL